MLIKIFGKSYDVSTVDGVNELSDLIQNSQANGAKQIAQALLTQLVLTQKKGNSAS